MKKTISDLRTHLLQFNTTTSNTKCVSKRAHAMENNTIAYICLHHKCQDRLLCNRCILEDKEHLKNHKKWIKTLEEFKDYSYDRCIDTFACEIDGVSLEVSSKFDRKTQNCGELCQKTVFSKFEIMMKHEVEKVQEIFKNKVIGPVDILSVSVQSSVQNRIQNFIKMNNYRYSQSKI